MAGRVLVVDDDRDISHTIKDALELKGYQVDQAVGAAALTRAEEAPPAIILLDVMMPSMGGYELMRQLQANPATAAIPVVLMSADRHAQDAVEIGAAGYLAKPFEIDDLIAMVEAHASKRE